MQVEILTVSPNDTGLFDAIAPDVFDGPIVADRLQHYLQSPQNMLVVAHHDHQIVGQIAGIIVMHPDQPNDLFIENLGVTPAFQRQGIARRLIAELSAWGLENGCQTIWVATEENNTPARALYERFARSETVSMYQWDL